MGDTLPPQMIPFSLQRSATPPAEEPGAYLGRLAELAGILQGIPWLLAGGLTIPLLVGRFYRPHYDVDVAFPVEVFPDVDRAMREAGFYLSTHFPMSVAGRCRFAVTVPLRHDGWLARHRPRKLKYRDATGTRAAPHLLAAVEALPFRVEDGCLRTCDGRHRLPLVRPLAGHRARAGSHEIECLDVHYVAALKRGRGEAKHALDLSVVAHQLPRHVGAEGE
jgi:hypothetical protein